MPSKQVRVEKVKPGTILYHYTKSNGVNGIINNNCFWATKSDFLNDPNEFLYIKEIIDQVFKEQIRKEKWAAMFLEDVMEENAITTAGGNKDFFVLSFSCCRDSITLWSEFGAKTGYNVGFLSDEIIARIEDKNEIEYHGLVIYDETKQKRIIQNLITSDIPEYFETTLTNILEHGEKDRRAPLYVRACKRFQKLTAIYAMFFKHSAFSEEQEYRFIFKLKSEQMVFFREKDGFLIPYVEIHLNKHELPVKEIVVAPQNHIDLAKKGMEYIMKYKGYNVPVSLSNIKLRY